MDPDRAVPCHCATYHLKLVQVVVVLAVVPVVPYKVHHTEVFIGVFLQAILNPVDVLPLVVKLFVSPIATD